MKTKTPQQPVLPRVFLLDNDKRILESLALYLSRSDCHVTTFSAPGKCLDELERNPADILVTDLRMPELDGLAVLKQVKNRGP